MRMCIKDGAIKDGGSLKGLINLIGNNFLRFLMGIILILVHINLMDVVTLIVIVNNHHHMPMNHPLNMILNHLTHKPHTTKHLIMTLILIHHTNHLMNHMNHIWNHHHSNTITLKNHLNIHHLHTLTKMDQLPIIKLSSQTMKLLFLHHLQWMILSKIVLVLTFEGKKRTKRSSRS